MPSLFERFRDLRAQQDQKAELEKQRKIQAEVDYEKYSRRIHEIEEKAEQKHCPVILEEVKRGYLNGKGEIHVLKKGQRIKFPSSYYEDGGYAWGGQEIEGPGYFLLWGREGNGRSGRVHYFGLRVSVYDHVPEGIEKDSREAEEILLNGRTREALEDRVYQYFSEKPGGEVIDWSDKRQHDPWENA